MMKLTKALVPIVLALLGGIVKYVYTLSTNKRPSIGGLAKELLFCVFVAIIASDIIPPDFAMRDITMILIGGSAMPITRVIFSGALLKSILEKQFPGIGEKIDSAFPEINERVIPSEDQRKNKDDEGTTTNSAKDKFDFGK